jgi:hypothetical protein
VLLPKGMGCQMSRRCQSMSALGGKPDIQPISCDVWL